ncbi:putative beta-lysine N-acetyltransferase [Natroniella sulfidigena]|uniref:putative beta-lysine N-acetyltransferase n=1 Tax=Natroniella sulfidigena TaxID=723921 RepID=UPI00200B01F7|nr:putative beta-lysine N-acetyltransferase [Natroniella sulfidigena]MCK8817403.1 putative beta-lysine N-acetyltransferase [Natroniella sulfidigena]
MQAIMDKKQDELLNLTGTNYQAQVNLSFLNKRIVIKQYQGSNLSGFVKELIAIANSRNLTKIWVKAHAEDEEEFKSIGFESEAVVKAFYGSEDAILMAFYLTEDRKESQDRRKKEQLISKVKSSEQDDEFTLPAGYNFRIATENDLAQLSNLYDDVFTSYPYPIKKEDYLKQMRQKGTIYGVISKEGKIVSAAAAETVAEYKNAELTDFATHVEHRGQGLAAYLLNRLEKELKSNNYKSLYTIARANVFGINKIFSSLNYEYTGRLIQNCNIAGGFEDMNVWSKVI